MCQVLQLLSHRTNWLLLELGYFTHILGHELRRCKFLEGLFVDVVLFFWVITLFINDRCGLVQKVLVLLQPGVRQDRALLDMLLRLLFLVGTQMLVVVLD